MPDASFHDDLTRFWDELVDDERATPRTLDPALAGLIRRLHQGRHDAHPDPDYATRLRADLMGHTSSAELAPLDARSLDAPAINGRTRPRLVPPPPVSDGARRARGGPGLAWPAVAALVLIAIGAGYLLFGRESDRGDHPKAIPAVVVNPTPTIPATPTPATTETTLTEVTIPASALPAGVAGSSLAHFTVLPGTSTWTVYQNAILTYLLSGSLTVRSENPMQVRRANGASWTDVPIGSTVSLNAEDALFILDIHRVDFANDGPAPVEMITWGINAGTASNPPMPSEWVTNNYDLSGAGAVSLSGSAARLRLRRVHLDRRAVLEPTVGAFLQFRVWLPSNDLGTPQSPLLSGAADGTINNVGPGATIYVVTLEAAGPPIAASPVPGALGSPVASPVGSTLPP